MKLEFRKLGSLRVPAIGMGTARTFDVSSEKDIAVRRQIVANCIANQSIFVDSSPMYGNAEKVVGITTEGQRDRLQFATKVWTHGRRDGEAQIARSFKLLRTNYIEVLQIHNLLDWRTHLTTLEKLKADGVIGLIGITHYTASAYPEMMEIMRSGRIDTVQIPYNIGERTCEARLLPLAEELGIGVIVMEPLGVGRYVNQLRKRPDLAPLAGHGIQTWAQALLAWVLGDPRVSVAIPATSRPERIAENALAGSIGRLPQELRDYIRKETERCL
jgi:aryl-alcohol dehydrogenase-like predicted oxidoreductase